MRDHTDAARAGDADRAPHAPPDDAGFDRRRFLRAAGVAGLAGVAGCSTRRDRFRTSTPPETTEEPPTTTTAEPTDAPYFEQGPVVGLEVVADGLVMPNSMATAPTGERYVIDQVGVVHALDPALHVFVDLTDRVVDVGEGLPSWIAEDERGLVGIALHPEFETNGRFFLRYSTPAPDDETLDHRERLSEFQASDDRTTADPASERILLELPWERPIHQAGALDFGPDGYLYAAFGDGLNPWNGQDITDNLKGSILRIDVDTTTDDRPYGIPDDNPLVGETGLPEQYAWGFRNPYKMAFSGDRLIAGDVGQELYEEIDVVEKGANYGWPYREGLHCHDPDDPSNPPETCRSTSDRGRPLVDPVVEFPHFANDRPVGFAVIGGYVYDGPTVDALAGEYVFGAYTSSFSEPAGRLLAATPRASGTWPVREIRLHGGDGLGVNVLGIGRDDAGELYVLGSKAAVSEKGWTKREGVVYRITPEPAAETTDGTDGPA